jgi:hypothetical protein
VSERSDGAMRREQQPTHRGRLRTFHRSLILTLLALASSCGTRSDREDIPDMSLIRGDPIVAPDALDGLPRVPADGSELVQDPAETAEPGWWMEAVVGEPVMVSFDELAGFDYVMPKKTDAMEHAAAQASAQPASSIPVSIRSLDGRKVAVRGFMLPTRLEGGLTTGFLLMRDQSMCCFGVIPRINEWVEVIMSGRGVRPLMDQPVTVFGTMHVGETYENGVLVGIYRMNGEEMAGPLDL